MFTLALPFDTDDPEFVRGVEIGMVYARLHIEALPICVLMHEGNAEMCLRLAEAMECGVRADYLGDGWIEVTFS